MQYRADIDGLRSLAVLPVVLYHADIPGPTGGFIGVDVFFVISGFLITRIIANEIAKDAFSLLSFYERRARRILPALTAVVCATFVVGWFVMLPAEFKSLGESALASALFLSNVYFLFTLDYFARAAEFSPLLHTWSLAVEEQFYLGFPLLLMALGAWFSRVSALWVVAGLSLVSLGAAIVVLPLQADFVFYLIFFRAWELGAGAMLALASFAPPRTRLVRETLAFAGLLGILVPVFLYDSTTAFPGLAALPPVAGAAVLIWIGAQTGGSLVSTLLAQRPLVWIGLISYSLYLWHWPVLAFLRIGLETATLPLAIGVSAVALSIVLAWLSYRFVERPFRKPAPDGISARAVFAGSGVAIGVVAIAGGLSHITDGVPGRLTPEVLALAAVAQDRNSRRDECFKQSPQQGFCRIGATGSATSSASADFLFWGDSHANAMMPGMEQAAAEAGQNGFFAAHSACLPIPDIQRKAGGTRCTAFNAAVWSWLETRSDVPLVILAGRWPLSVEGTRFGSEGGSDVRLEWIGSTAQRPDRDDNATLVEAGLRDLVNRIVDTGRDVVLIGSVPEIGRNVPGVAARAQLLGLQDTLDVTAEQFAARAGRAETLLSQLAGESAQVRYLQLSDQFCDDETCRVRNSDGLLLYRDDDHLSQSGARLMLPPRFQQIWQ